MVRIRSLINFSGVPKGTYGTAVYDDEYKEWAVTWDSHAFGDKPLTDYFDPWEFNQYLERI